MAAIASEKSNARLREQDVKIRLMLEAKKEEDEAIAVAHWETQLPVKSLAAEKKRQAAAMARSSKLISKQIDEVRRSRLVELFAMDDEIYEEELLERGLAFRKQRV